MFQWLKNLYNKGVKEPIEWIEIKVPSTLKNPLKSFRREKKKEEVRAENK